MVQSQGDVTISLIIPVYNVEQYVERCINSAVNQTVSFSEIIIIDDGSSDESLNICRKFQNKYKNVRLYSHENRGLGYTRNKGICLAKCDYIMFLDSDDELSQRAVECLKGYLKEQDYDVIFFAASMIAENGIKKKYNPYSKQEADNSNIFTGRDYFEKMYPRFFVTSACMAIYNRKFILNHSIVFQEGIFYEDNAFTIKIIMSAVKVLSTDEELYIRWERSGSIMKSEYTMKKMYDLLDVADDIYDYVVSRIEMRELSGSKYEMLLWDRYILFLNIHEKYFQEIKINEESFEIAEKLVQFCENCERQDVAAIGKKLRLFQLTKRNILHFEQFQPFMDRLYELNNKVVEEKLKILELNDSNKRIGIYGIGKHTEDMLTAYEKRYGNIKAVLCFFTTEPTEQLYRQQKVYPLCKAEEITEILIISSFRYMFDMIEKVREISSTIHVISLYDGSESGNIEWI